MNINSIELFTDYKYDIGSTLKLSSSRQHLEKNIINIAAEKMAS